MNEWASVKNKLEFKLILQNSVDIQTRIICTERTYYGSRMLSLPPLQLLTDLRDLLKTLNNNQIIPIQKERGFVVSGWDVLCRGRR